MSRKPTHAASNVAPTVDLGSSVTGRIARLRAALGDPFLEDPRLAHYALALEQTDATREAPTRAPSKAFLARADALLAAHEIARTSPRPRDAASAWADAADRASVRFAVESIARGHVRTVAGLGDLETALFAMWNEAPRTETQAFWLAIARAGLPFTRRGLLGEILAKGRIASREHYEFAVDMLGAAEEEGRMTAAQADDVSRVIEAYERR